MIYSESNFFIKFKALLVSNPTQVLFDSREFACGLLEEQIKKEIIKNSNNCFDILLKINNNFQCNYKNYK